MSVAINTSPAGALGNQGSWKRRGSEDEDERRGDVKKAKYSWFVTLESESPVPTDEDDESIYTVQGNETEFARDTSDTSTHTWVTSSSDNDDNSDMSFNFEYELADSRSDYGKFNESISSSSGSEQDKLAFQIIAILNSDGSKSDVLADNSDDSRSSIDSEIRRAAFRICVKCHNSNNNPMFRYCEKCYQQRKEYFPREKRRRKPRAAKVNSLKKISNISSTLLVSSQTSQELTDMDSGIASGSQNSSQDLTPDSQNSEQTLCDSQRSEMESQKSDLSIATTVTVPSSGDEVDSGRPTQECDSDACSSSPESVRNGLDLIKEKRDESEKKAAEFMMKIQNQESASNSENRNQEGVCNMCFVNPENGLFVHGKITHKYGCYKCAIKHWAMHDHRCPVCNRKATLVSKLY